MQQWSSVAQRREIHPGLDTHTVVETFIVGLVHLPMGFVDKKQNPEYHQPCDLKQACVTKSSHKVMVLTQ